MDEIATSCSKFYTYSFIGPVEFGGGEQSMFKYFCDYSSRYCCEDIVLGNLVYGDDANSGDFGYPDIFSSILLDFDSMFISHDG